MNKIITIIIILLISHCSFDNKTGIWKGNEKKIAKNVNVIFLLLKDQDRHRKVIDQWYAA